MYKKNSKYTLVNAKKQNLMHPTTFFVPSDKELESVKIGDFLKILVRSNEDGNGERFWIKVTSIDHEKNKINGKVINELILVPPSILKYNSLIQIKKENVLNIHSI